MSDKLVNLVREEDYLLQVFSKTKNAVYTNLTKEIVKFVSNIFRVIEPSHTDGKVVIIYNIADENILANEGIKFYDDSILNHHFSSLTFQLFQTDGNLPKLFQNLDDATIADILSKENTIAYYYNNSEEYIYVNGEPIKIVNKYSSPSIFALQYHFLNEALHIYKNDRIKKVSCEHFKNCWGEPKYIYFINKPEDSIQLSISEYLKNTLRGVDVVREYNVNASKPVDIRVFWREANRAALIEVKLMGRSFKTNGTDINDYEYDNKRANEGMVQIKEYIDKVDQDSPNVINKGYLVVVDGRRNNIYPKVASVSVANGMHFANKDLEIDVANRFYTNHKNVQEPIRMFAEPICD